MPTAAGSSSRGDRDGPVTIRDESDEVAVIGIWGPAARAVLQACTADDVSGPAFPFRTARTVQVGPAPVLAQRITYVGELGYELYVERRWAVQAYDALTAAGAGARASKPCGYRSPRGLRMEKGYRYYGHRPRRRAIRPHGPGLAFPSTWIVKGAFTGREALLARRAAPPTRRIRTLLVGGGEYLTVYGGEAVHAGGEVVGRLRGAAYGFTVGRNLAYAYLPGIGPGDRVAVEVFGELVDAEVAEDVQYDPRHERVRA